MKNTGFYRHVYDFSVDYDSIDVDDILDIHKFLMKNRKFCKPLTSISKRHVKCASLSNQPYKPININSNQSLYYPFTVKCLI